MNKKYNQNKLLLNKWKIWFDFFIVLFNSVEEMFFEFFFFFYLL